MAAALHQLRRDFAWGWLMRGVITSREVLVNLWVVWREFGTACVCRCLWAVVSGRSTTFLDLAVKPVVAQEE